MSHDSTIVLSKSWCHPILASGLISFIVWENQLLMHPLQKHIEQIVALTEEEFSLVLASFKQRKLKKGQYLLVEGETCTRDFFVLSGTLMQYATDDKGKMHVAQFALPNWWIADWDSILRKTPSIYNICTLEDAMVMQIDYEQLKTLFVKVPKIEVYFRVIFQHAFAAQQRRIGWLQLPANERYQQFISVYQDFELRFSQSYIASFLGITRESLSRLKSKAQQATKA